MNQEGKTPRPDENESDQSTAKLAHAGSAQHITKKPEKRAWFKKRKVWYISLAGVLLVAAIVAVALILFNRNDDSKLPLGQAAQHYAKQLPELKKKVEQNANDASARKSYAIALYATGELKDAEKQYKEAARLNDKDAVVYNNLGNVYRDLGKPNDAIDAYKKALAINPSSVNGYANLANVQLYNQKDTKAAITTYKQGLVKLPDNAQLLLLLGIAYEQDGDNQNAKTTYEAILSRDAENKAARSSLDRLTK